MLGGLNKVTLNRRQFSAGAGVIGPALFVGIFTLEGWLRPGYDPLTMYISALSLGPRGWIQIANFIVLGVLLLAFARGITTEFPTGNAARGGPILLTLLAVLFIISGIFVMDPMDTPPDQLSLSGTVHGLAGGIIFVSMPITIFVFLRRFRVDANWQSFQSWTLVLGIIEAAGVVFFSVVSKPPELLNTFADWIGLIQRAALMPFMLWLFLFALNLLKRSD
jgi:hypothetical protein